MARMGSGREAETGMHTFLRPLVMLAGGAVTAVALWHFLTLEPAARSGDEGAGVPEQLSQHDRQALEHLLHDRTAQP
jgi:hypothetical protein